MMDDPSDRTGPNAPSEAGAPSPPATTATSTAGRSNRRLLLRAGRISESRPRSTSPRRIDDVGNEQYDKFRKARPARSILLHLLKWDYQPERRSRSWIVEHRSSRPQTRPEGAAQESRASSRLAEEAVAEAFEDRPPRSRRGEDGLGARQLSRWNAPLFLARDHGTANRPGRRSEFCRGRPVSSRRGTAGACNPQPPARAQWQ